MTPAIERLFNRNFTLILSGRTGTIFSQSLYAVVLVLYLKQMTGSASILGAVELLAFLPCVLLGPFAGALVDRTSLKHVIVTSYALRGLLMLALFLFSSAFFLELKAIDLGILRLEFTGARPLPLYVLFGVTLCLGSIDAAFNSAMYAVVPAILAPSRLQKGNALMQGVGGLLTMAGNALGGLFLGAFGAGPAFLLNGFSSMAAAVSSLFLSVGPQKRVPRALAETHFLAEVKEGIGFILANKGLRNLTLIYALSNLFFPAVMLALPFLVEDVLALGQAYYGYLMSVLTFSAIAGYFLFGLLKTTAMQNYRVICGIFMGETLLFLALAVTKNAFWVFALLALLSGSMSVSSLINTTLKQQVIPAKFRGRVFATLDSLNSGLVPFSLMIGGGLIDVLDKNLAQMFFGIFLVYAILAAVFVLNGPIRSFYLSGCAAPAPEDPSPAI